MTQIMYWIILNIILAITMFILVPVRRIGQLFVYGLIGGCAFAGVIFMLGQYLNAWQIRGGIEISEYFSLLPTISWFFAVVIFGNYYPKTESLIIRAGYILLFATGSVAMQYIFDLLGMWRSINWNLAYTFLLAIFTHTLLSLYINYTEQYID